MADYVGYDYKPENSGGVYLRLKKRGDSCKIRMVSTPVHYQDEYQGKQNERFAWLVIDREDSKVKIFTAGVSIYLIIKGLAEDPEWGTPEGYDLTITRTEESNANYYKVIASPNKKKLTDEEKKLVKESNIDLLKAINDKNAKGTRTFGEVRSVAQADQNESVPVAE